MFEDSVPPDIRDHQVYYPLNYIIRNYWNVQMTNRFNTKRLPICSIIPISRFTRGGVRRIFEEVAARGTMIVVDKNVPVCVLVAPENFVEMIDTLEDSSLLDEAADRLKKTDLSKVLTQGQLMAKHNISQDDLDEIDVDIE